MTRRGLGAVLALALLAQGCGLLGGGGESMQEAAAGFLDSWTRGDYVAMAARVHEPHPDFPRLHHDVAKAVNAEKPRYALLGIEGERARYRATVPVKGAGVWTYENSFALRKQGDDWRVVWTPEVVVPGLTSGAKVRLKAKFPPRADVLGRSGPLTTSGPVVTVSLVPGRVTDVAAVKAALQRTVGVDPARVDAAMKQPADRAVSLIDLREPAYLRVKPAIYSLPGLVFRKGTARLTVSPGLRGVVGRVRPATAEDLERLGPPYDATSLTGSGGLEQRYERELAGKPTVEVLVADKVVATLPGAPGRPLRTTIDAKVQAAAEAAAGETATIVAVDVKTGGILAAVGTGALDGRYPPGSTFKIVTAAALVASGTTGATPVDCPAEAIVGGKRFKNFEGEALGRTTFREAVAHSCNTAFVTRVPPNLTETANAFGFGGDGRLGIGMNAFGGSFPEPKDDAERAAAAIGQGRVLASPLQMANVAAAAARGAYVPPTLLPELRAPGLTPVADVKPLLRAVVTDGTGTAANLPGVHGKTGTAEYGTGHPLPTHAWFAGWRGDVAFAVLVEGGGVGGRVAAPVARRFLDALGQP